MAGPRHCRGPGRSRVGPREERHPSCPGQACRALGSVGQRHLLPRDGRRGQPLPSGRPVASFPASILSAGAGCRFFPP